MPVARPAVAVADGSSPVVLEITPDVPAAMLEKIQGRILVTVRVLVDASGSVMGAMIEKPGPNASLAKLADEAAREWKFLPAERPSTRVWILTFEFSRFGVLARATAV